MHGRSIVPTFADPQAPPPRRVQYFEQMGHRGIWADGWKATTYHEAGQPFEQDRWGLYHLDADVSECHDLADEHPDKLQELVELWWIEAGDKGVLPLDDRTIELFSAPPRPGTVHARSTYTYVPPLSHIPSDPSPALGARAWTVTADVTVDTGFEGVIYARGSHNVGHSFFVQHGQLHFDYNALGRHTRVSAPLDLPPGRHAITARFDRDGKAGLLTIGVDGHDLASAPIPRIVRMLGSTGTDIGRDALSTVVDDYDGPFPFTGTIHSVTFDIRSKRDAGDIAATAATELARE
jgi:arylsulfatase